MLSVQKEKSQYNIQSIQSKKFSLQSNYETPSKNNSQYTTQKTLMKNIIQKISASRQNSTNSKKIKKFTIKQQNDTKQYKNQIQFQQIVLKNQSCSHPGFYEYVHWIKLHQQHLVHVEKKYVDQFWKILRLINYGQVFIPTGLVYQLFKSAKKIQNGLQFKNILNNFLSQNLTGDCYRTFKQLKNYTHIDQIQKIYKSLPNKKQRSQEFSSKNFKSQSTKNVFQRNFRQARRRSEHKVGKICQGIIQQQKKMSEKPQISIYKSQSYQSLIKPQRICHHPQKHAYRSQQQKYLQQNSQIQVLLKAKKIDRSIFEGSIDHIPGVMNHLSRNQFCQAERLRAKRISQRPQYSAKKLC